MGIRLEISLLKRLEEIEKDFLQRFKRYLEQVIYLPNAYNVQQVSQLQFPYPGTLSKLLSEHMQEVYSVGQAHGDVLIREILRKHEKYKLADWQPSCFKLAISYNSETFWLEPKAALQEFSKREVLLAGDVEGDIWRNVKAVLVDHLHGATRTETERAIAALVQQNMNRAALITTTETTYAYNRGRLTSYHGNGVDYVRFSAVMDARTSAQCRSRHGKVMRLDSPDLAANTPPLHGRCRSVLSPVFSKYQPELITPEAMDWSKVAALPKGWKTSPNQLPQSEKRVTIKVNQDALPNWQKAIIPHSKIVNYALNINHSKGGRDKAIAFKKALGYTQDNADELIKQVYENLALFPAEHKGHSEFGDRYQVIMNLTGQNGKTAKVLTGWIIDNNAVNPRLTTIHIDE